MSLKYALLATGVWTFFGLILSIGIITYIMNHPLPGVSSDLRAQQAGSGTGIFMLVGYAAIWIPFAIKAGKQRREQMQGPRKSKKRPPAE